jgi:hypothetical protein
MHAARSPGFGDGFLASMMMAFLQACAMFFIPFMSFFNFFAIS